MLVEALKERKCKSSEELRQAANEILAAENYGSADLEHAIDWLLQSMIAMEKTFDRVKFERDTIRASTGNIKEAYEKNLENNQTLSNEAKGFAYKIWRYNKKREQVDKILDYVRQLMNAPYFRLCSFGAGKKLEAMISDLDEKFKNYDKLVDIDLEAVEKNIQKYMERPALFNPQKINKEEFEKLFQEKK